MKNETQIESGMSGPGPGNPAGVITDLAALPEKAMLDRAALARMLGISEKTVQRRVMVHELPPGQRIGRKTYWLAGRVLDHLENRAEQAEKEASRHASRLRQIAP